MFYIGTGMFLRLYRYGSRLSLTDPFSFLTLLSPIHGVCIVLPSCSGITSSSNSFGFSSTSTFFRLL